MEIQDLNARLAALSPAKRALLEEKLKQAALDKPSEVVSIPRRTERVSAPLSFAQQRLWFLNQLEPAGSSYNESSAIRLRGALNRDALRAAINQLVARHEVLRTHLVTVDGEPRQLVRENAEIDLPTIDLRTVPAERLGDELQRTLLTNMRRPFDLSRDLPLRVLLVQVADQEHVLLKVMHHIASDGWSTAIVSRELGTYYRDFLAGKTTRLPALPIQYQDYAAWQRTWLQGEVLQEQLAYWKKALDSLEPLQLPTDRQRSAGRKSPAGRVLLDVDDGLAASLKTFSRQHGVTFFMTLLAAFQALLQRYCGQDDIVVGSPIAGRTRPELEGLIGFFVNTLVLRLDLSNDPTFVQLLMQARDVALGAYAHQELPFEKIVEELNPVRDLDTLPLFNVMFAHQSVPPANVEFAGLETSPVEVPGLEAKFDLFFAAVEREGRIRFRMDYAVDLFERVTIECMLGNFQNLLRSIVEHPERRISALDLIAAAEKQQLLVEWNDTARDYPRDRCVHALFESQAEKTPDAVAVVLADERLTYRELNERANQLGHYLRKNGVTSETPVAICMGRTPELIVGLLGILKAGGAYIPLDPQYPAARLRFILNETRSKILLSDDAVVERWRAEQGDLQTAIADRPLQVLCLDADWKEIANESRENLTNVTSAERCAYITYTSGSTGQPKGVEVLHRGITRLLCGAEYAEFGAHRTFLHLAPLAFDASTFEIWGALLHGSKCVLYPTEVPSPEALSALIKRQGVTTLWLTASLYNLLIDEAPQALSGLKQLLIGGEALSLPHVRKGLELLPQTEIINGYGPTESTTFACCYPIPRQFPAGLRAIPIGRPIANTRVYILDRYRQPVPVGVIGELYIGGDGLARGYLNRRELTAERFISCSFDGVASQRLYKTGDRARYLPDGNIEFLGRSDDQVKIRGYRIELGEIEAVLSSHSEVQTAAVMMREDTPGNKQLAAYIVGHRGGSVASTELRNFLAQRLPAFMVPAVFITLDSLPLTANGKVDRQALPRPESVAFDRALYTEPRTPNDAMLAQLWAESLGVERVGLHDNFFDLGGHSLLVVKVCERVKKITGREVPLATLFRAPTVAEFAQWLELTERPTGSVTLVPIQPGGDRPPLFCAHGAWGSIVFGAELSRQLGSGQPFYGLQAPGLEGEQEPLARIEEMAAHHVRELQRIQPEGPYYLAGLSMGGLVAFEIAQQLTAQGQKVALLGLIDTYCPLQRSALKTWRSRARRLFVDDFFGRVVFHGRNLMQLNTLKRSRYAREKTRSVGKRLVAKLRIDHQADKVHLADLYAVKVRKANLAASRSYRPQTYSGRITLFLTTDARTGKQDSSDAWRRLAAGGLDVRAVPGDHSTMLNESHVGVLAESLRRCLRQAQAAHR